MKRLRVLAIPALLAASASTAAPAPKAPSPPAPPTSDKLQPLTEADQTSSHKSGCNFSFSGAKDAAYVQVIEDELMFRTPAGLQTCSIANADAFMAGKGAAVCKGVSLKLRMTGRTTHYQSSDSSTGPARLSVVQGGATNIMHGSWGVAC